MGVAAAVVGAAVARAAVAVARAVVRVAVVRVAVVRVAVVRVAVVRVAVVRVAVVRVAVVRVAVVRVAVVRVAVVRVAVVRVAVVRAAVVRAVARVLEVVQAALAAARVLVQAPGLVRVGPVGVLGPARAREAALVPVRALGRVVARQQAMAVQPLARRVRAPGSAAREVQGEEEAGMAAASWGRRLRRPPPRNSRGLRLWRRRLHRSPRRISS